MKQMVRILVLFLLSWVVFEGGVHPSYAQNEEINPDFNKVDAYIQTEMKNCRIPGFSLGIVKDDKILYMKGYGTADPSNRGVTPQTPFHIASLSKSFTAMAIMQLADEGKIDLDQPVKAYIPWFSLSDKQQSSKITVRQLLNHTSGLGTHAEYDIASLRGDDTRIEEFVRKMNRLELSHKPGETFQYNNANYIILGQVIQSVTGLTYEDYIQQKIFKPLGMNHSYVSQEEAKKDGLAMGYRTVFGFPSPVELPYRTDFLPAYSILSSSEDMSKYMIALMNHGKFENTQILSEVSLKEMFAPSSQVSKWESYGLGWYVTSGSVYHGGEVTHYQSKLKILPEDSLGIVLMYNTSSSTLTTLFKVGYRDRIESGIINLLYGYEPDRVPRGAGILDLNRYPMQVTYSVYLGLCIAVVLLLVVSVLRLRKLRSRSFLAILLIHFILPLVLLFCIPEAVHATWLFILFYLPDAGYFTLATAAALITIGIFKVRVYLSFRKKST